MTVLEYRYRTNAGAGWGRVDDNAVTTAFRSSGTKWEQSLPLHLVLPYPIRSRKISPGCWICIPLGILGIWGGIAETLAGGEFMPVFAGLLMLVVATAMLIFGWLHRTEEWIVFPSSLDSCRVQFARQLGDRTHFDKFTKQLTNRIHDAHRTSDEP